MSKPESEDLPGLEAVGGRKYFFHESSLSFSISFLTTSKATEVENLQN